MAEPHKCPVCHGTKKVDGASCGACGATGVVWEPEESAVGQPDPTEINGL